MTGSGQMGLCLLISFIVLLALPPSFQAASYPEADLSLTLAAEQNGLPVQEVAPGSNFSYNITISNNHPLNASVDVVLTVKLPYDAEYVESEFLPALPLDYSLRRSGDLLQVSFESLPPLSSRQVIVSMIAPSDAPETLYAIAGLRYAGDLNPGNNRATLSTYVPLPGYNKSAAAKSLEDLLHNQSYLLFTFQDLLMSIPQGSDQNYTFTASFEQLLRSQACLTDRFQELLANESRLGWDSDFGDLDRAYLLRSYEAMLRDEADLFAGFSAKITDSWLSLDGYAAPGHSMDAQWELLASLEDLLKKQVRLYKGFAYLLHEIDQGAHPQEREVLVEFLASFEDLLRRQSDLLMGFEKLLDWKFGQMGSNSWEDYSQVQAGDRSD